MKIELSDLKTILEATGFPVAYSHFIRTENNPLPSPPFICYMATGSENFNADNIVYKPIQNVRVELYTRKKDLQAELVLEKELDKNEIVYESLETFIETEELFQKIYEMRLL